MSIRNDAEFIVKKAIEAVQPNEAVRKALKGRTFSNGRIIVIAVGKAAWNMASAAKVMLGSRIYSGVVITKYGHSQGSIEGFYIFEAGHPVPDENSFTATEYAMKMTENLLPEDTVLFLLSGGGSALFELPLVPKNELEYVTNSLLTCGANIVEMNIVRKRLSKVKGGKFAVHCFPAKVVNVVLSDIIGNPVDMIASGPTALDVSTSTDAAKIADKYNLKLSSEAQKALNTETPKNIDNTESLITGSVGELCIAAAEAAEELGYSSKILTDSVSCEAREAGRFLSAIAQYHQDTKKSLAFIVGGETVVRVTGKGKGGRNQEIALAAAEEIRGMKETAIFSVGSDGTDGPTDAAGGYADGNTAKEFDNLGISVYSVLADNDAYNALKKVDGLIITGPTGTNVNDVSVLLIRR